MRKLNKLLIATLLATTAGCCAAGALVLPNTNGMKTANAATSQLPEEQFTVLGGSVRVSNTAGIRFHTAIPMDRFVNAYGGSVPTGINENGTFGEGWTSGTLLLPVNKLGGMMYAAGDTENVVNHNATVSETNTTDMWFLQEDANGNKYMQNIVYLYNLPATQYGTEIAVRSYITNGTDYYYTEQVETISMSYVASMEFADEDSVYYQSQTLKETYIDKTVNVYVEGQKTVYNVDYLANIQKPAGAETRRADNDEFVGWFDVKGNQYDFKAAVKNNIDVYARYRESIVLKSLASDFAGPKFPVGDYKLNANDTVVGNTITFKAADGSTYALGYTSDDAALTGYDELKAETKDHGEGTVIVTLMNSATNQEYTLSLPALVVTQEITSLAEVAYSVRTHGWESDTSGIPNVSGVANGTVNSTENIFDVAKYSTTSEAALFGYYRLGNDLGNWVSGGKFQFGNLTQTGSLASGGFNKPNQGFRGTLDGTGYSMTVSVGARGIFGQVGNGAVIKNMQINAYGTPNSTSTLFATGMFGATVENVYIKTISGLTDSTAYARNTGFITAAGTSGTIFKNVTVDLTGKSFSSLFGGHYWGNGYESVDTINGKQNVYDGFRVYANSISAMGYNLHSDSQNTDVAALGVVVKIEDEIAAGNGIVYATAAANETVTVSGRQVLVANDSRTWSINIGKYADMGTVTAITSGGYNLGTDLDYLTIPEAMQADTAKHGEQNVTVSIKKLDGKTLSVNVPVTIVTKDIRTVQDFMDMVTYPVDATKVYGYYRLANNIGDKNFVFNAEYLGFNQANGNNGGSPWAGAYGFVGTFDGNGKTITGQMGLGGLFRFIGKGAVIKNVTIVDTNYMVGGGAAHKSLLSRTISEATVENVTFKIDPSSPQPSFNADAMYGANGWITSNNCLKTTFKDVTVEAAGYKMYSLFGANGGTYSYETIKGNGYATTFDANNTFENFVINAISLNYLGQTYANNAYVGITLEDEVNDADGMNDDITLNATKMDYGTVTLASTDIVLNGSTARNDIDLGDYASWTVTSITNGFSYANGKLTVSDTIRNDLQKHGKYTVNIALKGSLNQTVSVVAPVVVVTQEIMTKEEFIAAIDYNNADKVLFGYYTLGADIGSSNMGGGQPWRFGATAAVDNYGGRGLPQPELAAKGFRGTFDGRNYTITGRSYAGGLFGLLGKDALVKNVTIVDVYANGFMTGQSVLAGFAREATVENVTFKYSHVTWADQKYKPSNPGGQQYNAGWIVHTMAVGMSFIDCTVDAADYDFYALFGSGWYAGYEHASTDKTPAKLDNVYTNFQINVKSLSYLGYWYEGSTAWNALGIFHGVTIQDEVGDDDGKNDIIYLNGEKVLASLDENVTFAARDLVLKSKKTSTAVATINSDGSTTLDMDLGEYEPFVDNVSLLSTDNKTSASVDTTLAFSVKEGTYTIPANVLKNLDLHGESKLLFSIVYGNQNFDISVDLTIITLEITTAQEISTFLREYASVANDEVFNGFTSANQTTIPSLRWEGTNEYSGYFTLGCDINFASYTGAAGVTIGGVTYAGYNPYNVYAYGGTYWNPLGQDKDGSLYIPYAGAGYYYYPMGIDADPGNESKGFRGTFDGRGYELQGFRAMGYACHKSLSVTGDNAYTQTGFISKMTKSGVIKNMRFVNADMYLGALISSWGGGTIEGVQVKLKKAVVASSASYIVGPAGLSGKTNDVLEQFNLFKNSIVDLTDYDGTQPVVMYGNINYKNVENVYFIGDNDYPGSIISYYNSLYTNSSSKDDAILYVRQPMGLDSFEYFSSLNEFVSKRADIVNGWSNYLKITNGNVTFNGTIVMDGEVITMTNTDYLVREDGSSDYLIVYEDGNAAALEAAGFIAEHVRRATGTVTYTSYTGTFAGAQNAYLKEYLEGGVVVASATNAVWGENANYIVVGNVAGMPKMTAPTNSYRIETEGKSIFISASDDVHYLAAAIRFLEQTVGYQALNDGYVRYTMDATNVDTYALFETAIDEEVAFQRRSTTNANNPYRVSYKGINGQSYFNYGPAYVSSAGVEGMHGVHNSMYWLPNGQGIYTLDSATLPAGYTSNSNWYSTTTRDNGSYTGYDLCYIARGNSSAYNQMVEYTAQHMINVLNMVDPGKTWEVPLSFGCMDDLTMYYDCNCGATNAYGVKHNGSQNIGTREIIDFLNAVAAKVTAVRGDKYAIYLLGYYYAEQPEEITSMDSHLGVIYAPISRTDTSKGGNGAVETKSIYASENATVRSRIQKWSSLTDKMAFWFYDTRFENFFMPLDTYKSMITWLEFAARTCKDDYIGWVTVNGQSSNVNPTVFEDFKAYTVQMAEIEVLQKITVSYNSNATEYEKQLSAYLLELEQEFFGFSGDGSAVGQFVDGGYYGPATANHAMYQFYKAMCSNYQGKVGNNKAYAGKNWYGGASLETMTGICGEYYDYVKYGSGASSQSGTAKFADYLSSTNKYMYFANFTVKEIKSYMDYLETAIAAVNAWGDTANKKACLNHVLQESLFPRLIICMSNSTNSNYGFGNGYSHSNKSYWTGDLASARTAFYNDCVALGWTKYSEHNSISLIFNKWVSDGTSWSKPSGGTL